LAHWGSQAFRRTAILAYLTSDIMQSQWACTSFLFTSISHFWGLKVDPSAWEGFQSPEELRLQARCVCGGMAKTPSFDHLIKCRGCVYWNSRILLRTLSPSASVGSTTLSWDYSRQLRYGLRAISKEPQASCLLFFSLTKHTHLVSDSISGEI
jgi:hypothetical protein